LISLTMVLLLAPDNEISGRNKYIFIGIPIIMLIVIVLGI
jgi:hypothetical protein